MNIFQAIKARIWNEVLEIRYDSLCESYNEMTKKYVELRDERNRIRDAVKIERTLANREIVEVRVMLGKTPVGWAIVPVDASEKELITYSLAHVPNVRKKNITSAKMIRPRVVKLFTSVAKKK